MASGGDFVAMPSDPLDLKYGRAIPPQKHGADDWEKSNVPCSLSRLNEATATSLKQTMDEISKGWEIGEVLTNDTIIIWVVDFAGQIWFAIEELVLDGEPMGIPKHRKIELTGTAEKLGHPTLVGCANARIGGEIFFDAKATPRAWEINNLSGRYGTHRSRMESHLDNVITQFESFKVTPLRKKFFQPEGL